MQNQRRGRPRPDTGPLRRISIELDPRSLVAVDRIARREGLSRAAWVRRLLQRELDRPAAALGR